MIVPLLFAAATAVAASHPPCAGVKNPPLCRDLLEVYDRDQAARVKGVKPQDAQKIDSANLARVKSILNQFGWPGKSLVGEKASGAAWSIIQHADLATQKLYIDAMTKAAEEGQLSPTLLATTVDRMAVREGKRQIYGTQFKESNGELVPEPIDDEAHVDERRAKVGLPPLAEYRKTLEGVKKQ